MDTNRPRLWNIWWTLMVISASFTVIVLALEALEVFRDLGLVLSGLGILLTIVFGFGAASRSFLAELRGDVVPRLDGLRSSILGLERGTNERLDGVTGRLDGVTGRLDGVADRLDRVIALLDERLPRQST